MTCAWPKCPLPVRARGYCTKHHLYMLRHGLIELLPPKEPGPCEFPGESCGRIGSYQRGCRGADCRAASRKARSRYRRGDTEPAVEEELVVVALPEDRPCVGKTDLFFPRLNDNIDRGYQRWCENGHGGHRAMKSDPWAEARAICASCPVERECLERELAIGGQQYGFVGGKDPWERVRLIRGERTLAAS
jgi:hypothetical protein